MSHLLFMDESGHDGSLPYEVRGGLAIPSSRVWRFTQQMRKLEINCFGDLLANHGSEIKAMKLLKRRKIHLAGSVAPFSAEQRRELSLEFLGQKRNRTAPTLDGHRAYSQAGVLYVDGLFKLIDRHEGRVFASVVPAGNTKPPPQTSASFVRKDITFLFERFFYFLEEKSSDGMIVMDESDRTDDKRTLSRIERYFERHARGKDHCRLILPTPLFAASEMYSPIQAADVMIYLVGHIYRLPGMDVPIRQDINPGWIQKLDGLTFSTARTSGTGERFKAKSIFFVPEPWTSREG